MHYTTLIWMAALFLLQVLVWWSAFQRREGTNWTFFGFLLYLLTPILVSVPGYLLVSEMELELEPTYDLEREFDHNRKWFFAILTALGIASFLEYVVTSSSSKFGLRSAFPFVVIVLSIGGLAIRAKWAQLAIASIFLVALWCYLGLVFSQLG